MIQYCCDEYIFLDFEDDSIIICSKECGYKWIDEQFAEDDDS